MKTLITTTAIGLVLGTAAFAQQQPAQEQTDQQQVQVQQDTQQADQQQADQQQVAGFVQATDEDLFITGLMGTPVYAPGDEGQIDAFAQAPGHLIDSNALADFEIVGQIVDVMIGRGGEARGYIVALGDPMQPGAVQQPAEAPADQTAAGAPAAGPFPEVAIEAERIMFFADEIAPHATFAVAGIPAQQVHEGPLVRRPMFDQQFAEDRAAMGAAPTAGWMGHPGAAADWRFGRAPMAAPGVAVEGFAQVPATDVSADQLIGATVFGADRESIGSVGDVVLDAEGSIEYVTVDVGGFLGIGTREVAIGFDEMTILHDPGWAEVQVHVAATQADLEAMPEHQ